MKIKNTGNSSISSIFINFSLFLEQILKIWLPLQLGLDVSARHVSATAPLFFSRPIFSGVRISCVAAQNKTIFRNDEVQQISLNFHHFPSFLIIFINLLALACFWGKCISTSRLFAPGVTRNRCARDCSGRLRDSLRKWLAISRSKYCLNKGIYWWNSSISSISSIFEWNSSIPFHSTTLSESKTD